MNLIEARRILDRHKEGTFYSPKTVELALQLTGDLSEGSQVVGAFSETKGMEGVCLGRCEET